MPTATVKAPFYGHVRQYHSIKKPSYNRDRLQRYVAWFDKYLKAKPATTM